MIKFIKTILKEVQNYQSDLAGLGSVTEGSQAGSLYTPSSGRRLLGTAPIHRSARHFRVRKPTPGQ